MSIKRRNKLFAVLKLLLLIGIILLVPAYVIIYHRELILEFENYQDIVDFLQIHRKESVAIYLAAQVTQIIVCVLPGQVFQIAAGAVFGFLPGLLLSVIGAVCGASMTYFLARLLGQDAVHMFFGEEKTQRYVAFLNSERAYILIFLIYLIPGLPKDLVCYAAGISEVKFRAFLILSTVGRIPAMCGSLLFGHMFMEGNETGMITVAVIVVIVVGICLLKRDWLKEKADRIYAKIS